MDILIGIIVGLFLFFLLAFVILNEYHKKLCWIRDRLDLSEESNVDILIYINNELNKIYGLGAIKRKASRS